MNAPESYREALLRYEVAYFRVLFDPPLNVGAHGANLDAVATRMFKRCSCHLARDASPAKLRIRHDMRGDENGAIILAVVFEVPRFHATFRGNEALLVRKMSHGSHALSVAGARGSQQAFGYFGRRSRGMGRARLAHAGPTLVGRPSDPSAFTAAPLSFSLLASSSFATTFLPSFPLTVTVVHLTLLFFGLGLSTLVSPVLVCGVSWGGVLRDDQCSTIRFYPQEFRVFHMQEFCGCWFSTFSGLVAGSVSGRASLNVSPFF